jgi:hypothetical protein
MPKRRKVIVNIGTSADGITPRLADRWRRTDEKVFGCSGTLGYFGYLLGRDLSLEYRCSKSALGLGRCIAVRVVTPHHVAMT